jgi:hypothetical protein
MRKVNFSNLKKSKHLAIKNEAYLRLHSVVRQARQGFVTEQSRLVSNPARESASQILRQLDLIVNMVEMPYALLIVMDGYVSGWQAAFEVALGKFAKLDHGELAKVGSEKRRKAFEESAQETMRTFFAIDSSHSGALSQPWLFAITVYIWTAFECLASDLWVKSLNHSPQLAQRVISSISSSDDEQSGISKRHIEVGLAAKYGFDLRRHLGSALKKKFEFTKYQGILEAYCKAFGPCPELEQFGDELKQLEQVRHLIVHRGGITDDQFIKLSQLKIRTNSKLRLTLDQVRDYVMTVTLASVALLHTVDRWASPQSGSQDKKRHYDRPPKD